MTLCKLINGTKNGRGYKGTKNGGGHKKQEYYT